MIKFWGYYKKRLNNAGLNKLNKEHIRLILRLAVTVKKRQELINTTNTISKMEAAND